MNRVELGDEVECKVTRLRGIVTSITHHLTGCDRAGVNPGIGKDGKPHDTWAIDVAALKILKKAKVKLQDVQEQGIGKKLGGPMERMK